MNEEKRAKSSTTDGAPPSPGLEDAGAPQPIDPATGQHGAYWVLSEEERSKGFVRPVRRTYARDPSYYGATFCVGCGEHFPVAEFTWDDGQRVGS